MSNDKMRQEFEAKFPLPAGVAWKDSIGMYEVVDVWKLDKPITIGMYNWLWEGWQASRAAIVIELPDDGIEDCRKDWPERGKKYRYDTFDTGYLYACKKHEDAIESAGIKVRP